MTDSKTATNLDCKGCGVCCVALEETEIYCDVTSEDIERLTKHERRQLRSSAYGWQSKGLFGIRTHCRKMCSGPFKDIYVCVCYFLRGSLLHNAYCGIYDRRPGTCHDALQAGDRTCRQALRLFEDAIEREKENYG